MVIAGQFMVGTGPCAMLTVPFSWSTDLTTPLPRCDVAAAFAPGSFFMSMPCMPGDWASAGNPAKDRAPVIANAANRFISLLRGIGTGSGA
jgi:hypothetical protein